MEELRERVFEMIRMLPEDKLQTLLDFINHLNSTLDWEEPDDELLMT